MKSRGGLGADCILKPENVTPDCTDIFNALGDEFLFSTILRASFDFLGRKTGGGGGAQDTGQLLASFSSVSGNRPRSLCESQLCPVFFSFLQW